MFHSAYRTLPLRAAETFFYQTRCRIQATVQITRVAFYRPGQALSSKILWDFKKILRRQLGDPWFLHGPMQQVIVLLALHSDES